MTAAPSAKVDLEHALRQIHRDHRFVHLDASSPVLPGRKATLALDAARIAGEVHLINGAERPAVPRRDERARRALTFQWLKERLEAHARVKNQKPAHETSSDWRPIS